MSRKILKIGLASLALIVVLLIGVALGAAQEHQNSQKAAVVAQKTATEQSPPTRAELLKLVNAERAKYGVVLLKESPILDKSAQWKANDEVSYNYFGHVRPGTTGNDGLDYLNSLKPPCSYISENLTENIAGHNTAEQAVYSWKMSKPHFEAMINPKYTLTGFGIDKNEIVEHFCKP